MNFFSIRPGAWIASWPHTSTSRAWAALARAVILAVIVWFLWPVASAQTLGLSSNDIAVVNRLSTEALKHSSTILNAGRDLENTKFEEGAFGQILKSLNVTIGAGVGASDPFEQANVRGSVTVSVNLSSLTANLSAESKSPAFEARLRELERALKLEVLSKFSAWRISVARANLSADKLAVRFSEHSAMKARVQAGTATATDLLKAFEQVNDAQVDLLEKNHAVVIAKSDLARVVGVNLERLDQLLRAA
jgi:outer membrane protein TolC